MRETSDDLARLSSLLQTSIERAGPFLRDSFEIPAHSLSAAQLVAVLEGVRTVSFATVTAKGEPRVAPIGAFFLRGAFHIPTVATAARVRHAQRRPAVSLTYYEGNDLAVIVHGRATILRPADPDFAPADALYRELTGQSPLAWGEGVHLRLDADVVYTYAREPGRYTG